MTAGVQLIERDGRSAGRGTAWVALIAVATVAASIGLLWAFSYPGIAFFLAAGAVAVLLACFVLGVIGACLWRARRGNWRLDLLAIAVTVVCVLALIRLDVPLHLRWDASRAAFAREVQVVLSSGHAVTPLKTNAGSVHIGSYVIDRVEGVAGGGVLFYEATGNLFDNAGFAYLPHGPSAQLADGSFDAPSFTHLGGPWYSWTASW